MTKMKTAKQIRQEFIDFFKDKKHEYVPSWPVIPLDDPTLLFTNAGMNQFKDILLGKFGKLGQGNKPYVRVANSQKCIRVSGKHNDLEEVGHDTYHHTFFEMLGNWSFGDYYKKEAIEWGWELLTKKWQFPKDKLYATVYKDDDEAAELWPKVTDILPERVLRFGDKDNFWEMGATGPCGPCSEIHIDLGEDYCDMKEVKRHTCGVNGDCGRYIELWNLVFIQYYRDETGKLNPLPKKHVDTGMGFERIVSVIQGVYDNYKTDVFTPILKAIEEISGIDYQKCTDKAPFHVIADHIRMLTFSIGDGGLPSNEGRGYVIRRILRRAARYGRKLNLHEPFLFKLVPVVEEILGDAFPEIKSRVKFVQKAIKSEEESFNTTLDRGLELFEQLSDKLLKNNKKIIPGEEAFKLYDTYGFPYDLTHVLAEEKNMEIDKAAFEAEMEKQRARARQAGKFNMEEDTDKNWEILKEGENSVFEGYEQLSAETRVAKYAETENSVQVILLQTPFYAESGGQVGDIGEIICGEEKLDVKNTVKNGDEIIHICKKNDKFEFSGKNVTAVVNISKRREVMANHTATHLLHAALRKVLGTHVQQSGSLVEVDHFRFDFTHFEKVSDEQLQEIEQIVNEKVRENLKISSQITSIEKAKEMGAMALFGEKYGDEVRVISIEDYSLELCGGTHVSQTGQIGNIIITGESSIASGIRRIEAVSGKAAFELVQQRNRLTHDLSILLNAPEKEFKNRLQHLLDDKKQLEKQLAEVKKANILADSDKLRESAQIINGIKLIIAQYEDVDIDLLKKLGDEIRIKDKSLIGLLINKLSNGKLNFVCVVSDDLIKDKSLKAGDLIREVAKITGGGGGGRPHMATAGGNDANKIDEAVNWLKGIL